MKRGAIFPNRALREAGLFHVRDIRDMAYTDFFTSRAFAVVDHQIAHVYCRDAAGRSPPREACLQALPGVAEVLDRDAQAARGLAHARSGDLVLVAEDGAWFAYPWFEKKEAPDYASHVDIHNKPGYDPCELFFGWPPGSVSFDTDENPRHARQCRAGLRDRVAFSLAFDTPPATFLDLARATQRWMESYAAHAIATAAHRLASSIDVELGVSRSSSRTPFSPRRIPCSSRRSTASAKTAGIARWSSSTPTSPRRSRRSRRKRRRLFRRASAATRTRRASRRSSPGGEAVKNDFALVEKFMRLMLEAHLDRQSFVIIVGGGAVMDAVGLAAALVHRGLRQVRVPTTVLGQNDAGVGVKNGVNFLGGKNAIGTFAPPFAVLNDFDFLLTLPDRDWLCGVAEAFKVSIIRDRAFFDELVRERGEISRARFRGDAGARRCAAPRFISSTSAPMATRSNTGAPGRSISATGPRTSSSCSPASASRTAKPWPPACCSIRSTRAAMGWITAERTRRDPRRPARAAASGCGSTNSTSATPTAQRAIFGGLRDFQEHLGGELTVTFPRGIGARHEVHEIDLAMMEARPSGTRALPPRPHDRPAHVRRFTSPTA